MSGGVPPFASGPVTLLLTKSDGSVLVVIAASLDLMSKTTDPRSGETVYSLKNVKLAEPAATLFQVPSDYAIQ